MATSLIQLSNLPGNLMENFWEIPESILGNFFSIIDVGLYVMWLTHKLSTVNDESLE